MNFVIALILCLGTASMYGQSAPTLSSPEEQLIKEYKLLSELGKDTEANELISNGIIAAFSRICDTHLSCPPEVEADATAAIHTLLNISPREADIDRGTLIAKKVLLVKNLFYLFYLGQKRPEHDIIQRRAHALYTLLELHTISASTLFNNQINYLSDALHIIIMHSPGKAPLITTGRVITGLSALIAFVTLTYLFKKSSSWLTTFISKKAAEAGGAFVSGATGSLRSKIKDTK